MRHILFKLLQVTAVSPALGLLVCAAHAQMITITNPTPATGDYFGRSLSSVGTDRVLIGAYQDDTGADDAGAAYLFSSEGALLTTFTNPTPAAGDLFGYGLAALGTDRVLIGAYRDDTGADNAGAVYVFSTNGVLLTTITNPAPSMGALFGVCVAALGTDRVLVGAHGAADAGAVYLCNTNGALLTTFTNPVPTSSDLFGSSLAAVGTNQVLIGAPYMRGGEADATAYLFSTDGLLLTTITNPSPSYIYFGGSLTAVGEESVLIGVPFDGTNASRAGAACLFSTNGALLKTFTNPTFAYYDYFGMSVAAVGTDRVLIGAHSDNTAGIDSGAAYLFSLDGALLNTFTNPTPAADDYFGWPVAAMGTNQVIIGAPLDDLGAIDAGVVYLFNIEPISPGAPVLSISHDPELPILTLSWPESVENWMLEREDSLPMSTVTSWTQIPPPYQTNAGTISVELTNAPAIGSQFFRLHKQ